MQNPVAIPFFFFSAWLAMVFWGMMAPEFGLPTISYLRAMLVTVAIWLVVGPLTWGKPGAKRSWGAGRRY
ncbi:MAG: hypothetical protein FJ317_08805, partial [SAR202 cluster bacterium]|nr:hypothetical protein [SAR202 cluster bacterium]